VGLLKMGRPGGVWSLLKHGPDPRGRSYLIHRFGPLGSDPAALVRRLEEEPDVSVRRALILSLGPEEFGEDAWSPGEKENLVRWLRETYSTTADPGLRAAAEWLLRQWKDQPWLAQAADSLASDSAGRDKRFGAVRESVLAGKESVGPRWYVTGQGQTMVAIPGPVDVVMGRRPRRRRRGGASRSSTA
jgi:hypothetical protein